MVAKADLDYREAFLPTMEALSRDGVLLVSVDGKGRPSGMTIGWGSIGIIWSRRVFTALLRPSRNTYGLVEAAGDFTVNLLPSELGSALAYWGSVSGREEDKWSRSGLRPASARLVRSPIVEQGVLHFECRVLYHHDLAPANLAPDLLPGRYDSGNYHRVYYGEILACYGA